MFLQIKEELAVLLDNLDTQKVRKHLGFLANERNMLKDILKHLNAIKIEN